jgi:hypothetical protein
MSRRLCRALGFLFLISLFQPLAFAMAGEAAAVLAHCGPASGDTVSKPSNGPQERILTYNDIALRFEPYGGDWSFFQATQSGVPLSQAAAIQRLPCLGDALEEVLAQPATPGPSETSTNSTGTPHTDTGIRDDVFIALAILLVLGIVFFAIRPYTKSTPVARASSETPRAPTRRPSAVGISSRSRKAIDSLSDNSRTPTQTPPADAHDEQDRTAKDPEMPPEDHSAPS